MIDRVTSDLAAEQQALDDVVAAATGIWNTPTPSAGWDIADQIGHLTYFDGTAALAITDPAAFATHRAALVTQLADAAAVDTETLGAFRALGETDQLDRWRTTRSTLIDAADQLQDGDRVEWYGPSMGAASFLTARLMEVWAHGQDVVDALNTAGHPAARPDTDRLQHIAQLGFITRKWSYRVRGDEPPTSDVRVELIAPSGATWHFGNADAAESIIGPAGDFCRVVTQRRHVDDTELQLDGDAAREWMLVAQAFAGAPTSGPPAGTFNHS